MLKLKEDKNVSTASSSFNLTLFSAMKSQKCHEFDLEPQRQHKNPSNLFS